MPANPWKRSLPGGVWEQVRQSNGSGYCPGTGAASFASVIHRMYLERDTGVRKLLDSLSLSTRELNRAAILGQAHSSISEARFAEAQLIDACLF